MRCYALGKSRKTDKEYTREQRLSKENKELKKENGRLRKALSRHENLEHVRDFIEESQEKENGQDFLDKMKDEWKCRECGLGYLEITIFNKINQSYYFRKCNGCNYRTKSQKYSTQVRGIIRKEEIK
jgi:hypothetical protein